MDSSKSRVDNKMAYSLEGDSKGKTSSPPDTRWNVVAARGKLTDRCLWSACKAMTAGILLLIVGAGMATLGFYSDHMSKTEDSKGNMTTWVKTESKYSHLSSLTYLGPVVMGIGGFTIVAACVMTFEARDTASKIVPIWFKRTRIHVVSGGSGSTPSDRSSKASWDKFLSQQKDVEDTRTAVTQALVNFSKYLQNSVDTNRLLLQSPVQQTIGLRKCPSEPSLAKQQIDTNESFGPDGIALLEISTPQPSQRTTYSKGLKTIAGTSKPQLLSVAPDTYRQAVSMDCPRSSRIQNDEEEIPESVATTDVISQNFEKKNIQKLPLQTSCATSSSGSMSVDIYLPQGSVTLKIHDDMRDHKRSPLKPADSDDSRYTKLSQQSDMQSFDDELLLSTDVDDSVFINQEPAVLAPQIILDTSDSKDNTELCTLVSQSIITEKENLGASPAEQWATTYHSDSTSFQNKSDSLEVHSSEGSPLSLSISTNYSFECSERDSVGSVISNPFSSRVGAHPSLSFTDTSFVNVSSLNSMGSSQDISSPLVFCGSPLSDDPRFSFDTNVPKVCEFSNRKVHSVSDSTKRQISVNLESDAKDKKASPRKHSSLELTQICSLESSKSQQLSLESSSCMKLDDPLLMPPQSPRFLSSNPLSPITTSPIALSFSPRKVRSESLPERRQAPSIKRFPLLRQGALDSLGEESGFAHRLDRSQTQISSNEP